MLLCLLSTIRRTGTIADGCLHTCFTDWSNDCEEFECQRIYPRLLHRTWSDLVESLRTSLHHDLKLPQLAANSQRTMESLPPIDDLSEEELRE